MAYRPFIPRDQKIFRNELPRRRQRRGWMLLAGATASVLLGFLVWPGTPLPAGEDSGENTTVSRAIALPGQNPASPRGDSKVDDPAGTLAVDNQSAFPAPIMQVADAPAMEQPENAAPNEPERNWQTIKVRPGDTLAAIFSRHGLGPATVHHVVYESEHTARLRDLKPGEELKLSLDDNGGFAALRFDLDEARLVEVAESEGNLTSRIIERPIETRIARASGVIDDSLYMAAKEAGLSDPLTMKLAHIFAWDIDFVYDIRAGDRFYLIYEELYREGDKLRDGEILAATFVNRNERITAVHFDSGSGEVEYYTPNGRNMRKEFLRTPVDFRRISSRFNPNRLHPTLGYRRPHEGVDYAADTGTPVIATGNGRVKKAGWWGGYGNCIVIEHAGRYQTLYAHLSKYARGVKAGARVRQGQIIGYVGMTGTATGPHLHYEFHVDGRVRDPLKVDFPPAPSLPETKMAQFRQVANPLVAQLDAMSDRTMLASRER